MRWLTCDACVWLAVVGRGRWNSPKWVGQVVQLHVLDGAASAVARCRRHYSTCEYGSTLGAFFSSNFLSKFSANKELTGMLTYGVLDDDAPWYLGPFTSTTDVPGRRALRSAGTNLLIVVQLDCPPSAAELFRLLPLKSGTLYRNTSSQLPRCSPSGVTWKRFYYNILSVYSTLVDFVVVALVT